MNDEGLAFDARGAVATLTLRRPEQLNALNAEIVAALRDRVDAIAADDDLRCVVVTGDGKAFSAGADIKEFGRLAGPSEFRDFIQHLERTLRMLEVLPKPSIAAVNGVALGGGLELAAACDLRVADPRARFGVPEIKLGLLPGAGGTQRLPRLVPAPVAKQMLLTGEPIDAQEAWRVGLVNEVTEEGRCVERAVELATALAERAPLAVAAAKQLVDHGTAISLEAALALERETVSMLFDTNDRVEGIAAFVERRPPTFRGQ
jgi:enoyl-CoA hydratase/carnithine racemase